MSLVSWQPEYELGHAQIDGDHRSIVALLNELNNALALGTSAQAITSTITQLDDYVRRHFSAEEALMDRVDYPDAAAHKKEHARLSQEFGRLRGEHAAGRTGHLDSRLLMFLADWWIRHILGWDAKLLPLIQNSPVH